MKHDFEKSLLISIWQCEKAKRTVQERLISVSQFSQNPPSSFFIRWLLIISNQFPWCQKAGAILLHQTRESMEGSQQKGISELALSALENVLSSKPMHYIKPLLYVHHCAGHEDRRRGKQAEYMYGKTHMQLYQQTGLPRVAFLCLCNELPVGLKGISGEKRQELKARQAELPPSLKWASGAGNNICA